jgi:hypothetical protein
MTTAKRQNEGKLRDEVQASVLSQVIALGVPIARLAECHLRISHD